MDFICNRRVAEKSNDSTGSHEPTHGVHIIQHTDNPRTVGWVREKIGKSADSISESLENISRNRFL